MIRMTAAQRREIEAHGEETYPNECCGFLIGGEEEGRTVVRHVWRAPNGRTDSPFNRYQIEPGEYLRADREAATLGLRIVGIYHSHPDVPARPSEFDRKEACSWYVYVIVSIRAGLAAEINAWVLPDEDAPFQADPIETV